MKKVLVTGGTVFVSKYVATYYVKKGYEVYVLNRNTKEQVEGVKLIECDRYQLENQLKDFEFDVIFDMTSYSRKDVETLIQALPKVKDYIFLSSSAVYPESLVQPFREEQQVGPNTIWGDYGVGKYEAEEYVRNHIPQAYFIRPPYLYGPMNNVYREAFVFECALKKRAFYIPKDGNMKLQFFYINDLCRIMDEILKYHPKHHIFNVGNKESVTILDWVKLCYDVAGAELQLKFVQEECNQRNYFSFYNYDYYLDITKQKQVVPKLTSLKQGLRESFAWYQEHEEEVKKKPFITYIDEYFIK